MSNSSTDENSNPDPTPGPSGDDAEFISKTTAKRDAERLQKLGKRIAELSNEQRAELALPPKLVQAIDDYNRFPSREAKRRQLQFVGKVMRAIDADAIAAKLADLSGHSAKAKFAFHQTELWRERLIAENQALAEYIDAHPQVDRQALRHAIKKVRTAKTPDQEKLAARALFRFLRETEDEQGPVDQT